MDGDSNFIAKDYCHRGRAIAAKPKELNRSSYLLSRVRPEIAMAFASLFEAEYLALIHVEEMVEAARVGALREHKKSPAIGRMDK